VSDLKNLHAIRDNDLKVRRHLFLREFADAFEDDYLRVWLNPSGDFYLQWNELSELEATMRQAVEILRLELLNVDTDIVRRRGIVKELSAHNEQYRLLANELLAQLWDCDAEAVDTIRDHSQELFNWCLTKAFKMVGTYGAKQKKGSGAPSSRT